MPPPVTIVRCAGPFGRDHRRAERAIGCAADTEGGALVRLFLPLQDQPGNALRRFVGSDVGDVETAIGVELCIGRGAGPAAGRYLADPSPLPRYDLEDVLQYLQGRAIAFARTARAYWFSTSPRPASVAARTSAPLGECPLAQSP